MLGESPYTNAETTRVRAWLEVRQPLERQLEPLGQEVIAALQIAPGERVLDIGCGVGSTPRALAHAVGPTGHVCGIDVLQTALDVLRSEPGLPENVTFLRGDAQSHPFEPRSFDVAFSRFGVMFFDDPVAAFANIRRALRPGGRLGFVCWRGLDENELDGLPLRVASPHLPAQLVTDTAASGWFSLSEAESIRRVLRAAGFTAVQIASHDAQVGSGSLQAMVDVCSRVGALGAILRDRPDLRAEAVRALKKSLRALDSPTGPTLRAATWIVTADTPI